MSNVNPTNMGLNSLFFTSNKTRVNCCQKYGGKDRIVITTNGTY